MILYQERLRFCFFFPLAITKLRIYEFTNLRIYETKTGTINLYICRFPVELKLKLNVISAKMNHCCYCNCDHVTVRGQTLLIISLHFLLQKGFKSGMGSSREGAGADAGDKAGAGQEQ